MKALERVETWNRRGAAPAPARAKLASIAADGLWLFAYGPLMWEPGFAYYDAKPALLYGHHRRFCVYSHGQRGAPDRPGLVLGLDRGGACKGIAFRIPAVDVPRALAYLWGREMQSPVYRLKQLRVQLRGGRLVKALALIVDRAHPSYAGALTLAETARLIGRGHGRRGTARHDLGDTVRELQRLGVVDGPLHRLQRYVTVIANGTDRAAPRARFSRISNSRSSCTGRSLRPG
ncbi:MAG TPA: gamma-glutamylcyclotransferase [Stellaceae bacterium]|nr:gamma-glutamylcyclotransferase [Stellaceae bacterium]